MWEQDVSTHVHETTHWARQSQRVKTQVGWAAGGPGSRAELLSGRVYSDLQIMGKVG